MKRFKREQNTDHETTERFRVRLPQEDVPEDDSGDAAKILKKNANTNTDDETTERFRVHLSQEYVTEVDKTKDVNPFLNM